MKRLKIAIIDSGIDIEKFNNVPITQYFVQNYVAIKEIPQDYYGHGTSMMSILFNNLDCDYEILSFRVGGNNKFNEMVTSEQLSCAIRKAVDLDADIINISMGSREKGELDSVCENAFKKNVAIVVAASNRKGISYPYNCSDVIRVVGGEKQNGTIEIDVDKNGYLAVKVNRKYIKGKYENGRSLFTAGNSGLTALVTSKMCNIYNNDSVQGWFQALVCSYDISMKSGVGFDDIFKGKNIINKKFNFVNRKFEYMKNVVVVPYSKEISGLFRFQDNLSFEIKQVLDPILKGNVGKDPFKLNGCVGGDITIRSKYYEDKLIDTMIIGYLTKVKKIDSYFSLENLLDIALANNLNVYSFEKISDSVIKKFNEKGLIIDYAPVIDESMLNELSESVKIYTEITKPVIGVFGTSSNAGKFTMQIIMKNFLEKEFNVAMVGTEHQSELFGVNFCYPVGYMGDDNIKLNIEKQIEFLHRVFIYIEHTINPDIILTGGQSRLLPYNIQRESIIHNIAFLEGVKPDIAILVINPKIDNEKYVRDTISLLESVFKCKVLSIAYSDKTPEVVNKKILRKKINQELIDSMNAELSKLYGVLCGCITDSSYHEKLRNEIVKYLS